MNPQAIYADCVAVKKIYSVVAWNLDLRYKMLPSMQKVCIFYSDPDATDSSDNEDDQNPKKEKKLIGEVLIPLNKEPSSRYSGVPSDDEDDQNAKKENKLTGEGLVPLKKEPSSRFRGVRRRSWGSWQVEIRNPFTKKKECTTYKTEEEAAAAYQEKRKKYDAMKTQLSVPECTSLFSSSSLSGMSTSMPCKKKEEEAHRGGVSTEADREPTDENILNYSPTFSEVSVNAFPDQLGKLPVSESAIAADEHSPRDAFPVSDFIGATYEPLDNDYIGLADISHLPLPFKDQELDLDAEPDWSWLDREPDDK